jgi:hypothetical protein
MCDTTINMNLKEIGCENILLSQDGVQWRALVKTLMNLRIA